MNILNNLKYSKNHEWVKVEGSIAKIGITDFAQHSLGNIVFIEMPEAESELNAGDVLGVIESVKAASDFYSPLSGKVLKINDELVDSPERINEDPYGSWIIEIELSNSEEVTELLSSEDYAKHCEEEA